MSSPNQTAQASGAGAFPRGRFPGVRGAPPRATDRAAEGCRPREPTSCGRPRHRLVDFRDLTPDRLFELALDAVRLFQAYVARDLGHDVGIDLVLAIAELDVDASFDLGVGFDDGTDSGRKLGAARGHVLSRHDFRFHRLEAGVDPGHVPELGAQPTLE